MDGSFHPVYFGWTPLYGMLSDEFSHGFFGIPAFSFGTEYNVLRVVCWFVRLRDVFQETHSTRPDFGPA